MKLRLIPPILCHEWREETRAQFPAILAELRRRNGVLLAFGALQKLPAASAGGTP